MRKPLLIMLCALLFTALPFGAANAQGDPPTADEINAVARQLYCPVCENIPLDVCPTQACAEWREEIASMLAQGKTEEEIKQHFVTYYGDRVLATPPARGLNWLVYIIPPLAFLLGAYVLYRAFKSWKKPEPEARHAGADEGSGSATPDDEYVRRMEEELRKL